jgi:hypothetical protein
VGFRFNPPPGWPPVPEGFVPPPGWQPDPSWPPPPPGWQLWVSDGVTDGPGAAQPFRYQLPAKSGTNGFAVASLVLGILGVFTISAILSLIFGGVALAKIRNAPQKGRGMAIAGMVLSVVWLVVLVVLIAVGASGGAHRSGSGHISKRGSLNIFALHLGDCLNNPNVQSVSSVAAVPCTQPHNAQVFAQFDATGSGYPGATALTRQSTNSCNSRVNGNLDRSKITGTMSIRFIFPLAGSWALGHRIVSCLIVDPAPDLTSSLLVANPRG